MTQSGPALEEMTLQAKHEGLGKRVTATPLVDVNGNVLQMSKCSYLFTWTGIVGLHCICAVYLSQLARLYAFFMDPYMQNWMELVARGRVQYYERVGIFIGLIAVLHWWQLLCILWASLKAKELVLLDGSSSFSSRTADNIVKRLAGQHRSSSRVSSALVSARFKKLALPSRFAFQIWRFFFSRHGVFGIESDFFPVVFIIRELIEIVSQTFQAHRSSESLPRPWLNNLFVTLVVLNCWSTPILQHFFRGHQGMERVVCLLLDTVLNMGSSIFIPVIIFLPYYEAFIPQIFNFPFELMCDHLFFSRLVMENQLLFSLSNADIFSRLVPHLGIFSSLSSVSTLIHRTGSHRVSRVLSTEVIEKSRLSTFSKRVSTTPAMSPRTQSIVTSVSRKKKTLVHAFFFVWGLVVLILHTRGALRAQKSVLGCRQVTGSWFTKAYPCSVYAYNCYRQGTATPDEDSWAHLDQSSLVHLTVAHCPELKMPHRFQSFPNLLGFQLHNTTIVEWSKESSISATKHTKLSQLIITRTNMSRIPDGMLEPLPASLMQLEMTYTNLTSLPDDLDKKWHPISTMYLEHSLITEFPKVLLRLQVRLLSLHSNLIERLPELETMHQFFIAFTVSGNPLVELPATLGEGSEFIFFGVENTLIETLPAWVHTNVVVTTYLSGTPYCATQAEAAASSANLECVVRDMPLGGKSPVTLLETHIPL